MAQIIRHRKGVLESVASATKRKAELLIVTGSSGITSTNSDALIFFGDGTDATVGNKILYGTSTPDLTGASYSTAIDGLPYYNTSESKLYILSKAGNIEVTQNLGGTGIISGSQQIADILLSGNQSVDLGTGTFEANGITSDAGLTVSGTSNLQVISGSNLRLTGNANIAGNITLGGNISIGDASTDTISLGGEINSNIIPASTDTYTLGSATDKFSAVHATTLYGAVNATNGVVSGSSQVLLTSADNTSFDTSYVSENASYLYYTDARVKTKLNAETVISGSSQVQIDSVTGFTAFSSSADSRLDAVEASLGGGGSIGSRVTALETFSASAESNDTELFATASDHEGRLDTIEGKTLVSSSAQVVSRLSNQTVNFGSGDITANSFSGDGSSLTNIPLGTATTGDYVDSLVAGTGITITNNSGEGATPTIATAQNIADSASPTFVNLTLTGDLSVNGTTTTTNQTTLTVSDSKIFLADGNAGDSLDAGIIFNYNDGSADDTAGIFRDATDGSITFYGTYTGSDAIGNTIDTTAGGYSLATVKAGTFDGALDWSNIANKPDPELTVTLGGTVTGTGTVTMTDLGDATLIITSSIPATTNLTLNDLTIDGNLTVTGTQTVTNTATISSDSPIQILNSSGSGDPDVGLVGKYDDNGTTKVNGFFRDATDGIWKVFDGSTQNVNESALIDTSNAGYSLGTFQASALSGSIDWGFVQNTPEPTITINAGGNLSGSTQTTLTNLGDGTLDLDLFIPTSTNLTLNNLTLSSNLSVTGNSTLDRVVATNITASAGVQVGTNLTVGGNATVTGDITANDLILTGNLTVQGTTTQVDSTTIQLGDNILELNGTGAANGGLLVKDATAPNTVSGSLLWDSTNDYWKAGALGSESKLLRAGGDSVVSGSSQISADQTDGWADDVKVQLDANTVISGSSQVDLATVQGDTDDVTEGVTNLYYTDARVKTKLDADGVISGSSQVSLDSVSGFTSYSSSVDSRIESLDSNLDANVKTKLNTETVISGSSQVVLANSDSSSFDTDSVAEGTNLYYTEARVKTKLNAEGVISGSQQITTAANNGEVLMKAAGSSDVDGSAIYSDGSDLIAIGTPTANVGDLASGNQLSLYGSSISGLLSFDISGTAKSFDYVSSNYRYIDTNTGVGIALKPDANANKAWVIDTDGDLVSGGGTANAGVLWSNRVVATGAISGSALRVTGNAQIDGNLTLGGNITIGDASSDSLTINADIESDIRPNLDATYDLGATTLRYAEIHGVNIYGTHNGVINASNGVISGSAQVVSLLSNQATDFGSGRVSGDNFGDVAGTSTFTGSFVGDGSGITGLSTTISVSGSDGSNDTVSLLDGAITFAGGTGVSATVATDTVTISVQDASTSVKGIASFSSDDFTVSSGDVTLKAGNGVDSSGGVRGANLNADVAGDGLSYSLSNQQLDVDYGSTANTAVEGNTTLIASGSANEIEITTANITLGSGGTIGVRLPQNIITRNDLTVSNDLSVSGNATITGNLSVLGTTTTIDSTTVQIGDNIIELNIGGAQSTAGLQVTDATAPNTVSGSLLWDGANDYWKGGQLGSEKEFARLNASPTSNTVLKANASGLLVDSVLSDDGTDATFSGDVIIDGLTVGSNGAFLYVDTSNKIQSVTATNAGDVIQWDGSSFVASNGLDGGTF